MIGVGAYPPVPACRKSPNLLTNIILKWLKDTFPKHKRYIKNRHHKGKPTIVVPINTINMFNVRDSITIGDYETLHIGPDFMWFTPPIFHRGKLETAFFVAHLDFEQLRKHVESQISSIA